MSDKAKVKEEAKRIARGQRKEDEIFELSTGVRVRLHPVSTSLVEEVQRSIPMPTVPVVYIEAKDREEENPNDPAYIAAVEEATEKRGDAAFDALCMFGVELVDGLPEDDMWLKKLRFLERRGTLDFSGFNLKDQFDLEFIYKRYVAIAGADLRTVSQLHGFNPMEVARSRAIFLGEKAGDTDRGVSSEQDDQDGD